MEEIAKLLDCDLSSESLAILAQLVDQGVNPEALAACLNEIQFAVANGGDEAGDLAS